MDEWKFGITKETAERALRVLEWYCNDTGKVVVPRTGTDGKTELYLTANTGPTICPCCLSFRYVYKTANDLSM